MVLDLLSDMLARINNGYMAKLIKVNVLRNKQNLVILSILLKLGFISGFQLIDKREIIVFLSYYRNKPAIRKLQRISKSSHRIYFTLRELQNRSTLAYSQNGFFILSTTIGILTDVEALALGVGGEVLFQIV